MSKVEIICSSLVGIASNNASPMLTLELTPFDLRFLLLSYAQRGIIFHKPQSHHNFIHHLKNSLSRTLEFFPPLAGRLAALHNDDNTTCFFLDCNNAGVEFVHAVARHVSVSDILEPKFVPEELVSSLFRLNGAVNVEGTYKPLLGIQVTELADGVFIAGAANHSVVDGISFWHFLNSWAEISRGSDTISKPPVFERKFGNRRIPLTLPLPLPASNPPELLLRRRVFQFSRESLGKLKAKASSEAGTPRISSLQALSAHLWRSYTRCRVDDRSDNYLMMAIGGRVRIPLPDGYFGCAVYVGKTAIDEAEGLQGGLGYVAVKIKEFIAQQTKESAIKMVEEWMKNPVLPVKGNFSFTISGSPTFNVYGNDFGWGKPIGMRSGAGIRFDGNMTTFPSADGGIEVHACSAPETLQAMEDDAEFMEAFAL